MSRRNWRLGSFAIVAILVCGCDSTVGLDPTNPTFTKVLVPGVCPVNPDLSQIGLSVLLLDGTSSLVPDSRIAQTTGVVRDLLSIDSFRFNKAPQDLSTGFQDPAVIVRDDGNPEKLGVSLGPVDLSFHYPGSEERKDDNKLVILIMDHSGSLSGLDPATGQPDNTLRTDYRDERISFFDQLVSSLPRDYFVSLVKMNDRTGNIATCDTSAACGMPERVCSNPTKNRDPINCGLRSLQFNEQGLTPLDQTLRQVMTSIIKQNTDLNPVVVVFSDGVESGDMSGDILGPDGAASVYEEGINGQPVPIIFVHLSAPRTSRFFSGPSGRTQAFQELACRTGGDYIFLEDAAEFLENSDLQPAVVNRIEGVWRLTADTSLGYPKFDAGGYLLSTSMTVTLGGKERTRALQRTEESSGAGEDSRIWMKKP
jgi:hypothetical protein